MSDRAFEVGDRVHIVEEEARRHATGSGEIIGIVRSVDKNRRRTEPYYIYYVELPGEARFVDFEYRELAFVSSAPDEVKVVD